MNFILIALFLFFATSAKSQNQKPVNIGISPYDGQKFDSMSVKGGLSKEQVMLASRPHRKELWSCFESLRRQSPRTHSMKAKMSFTVNQAGKSEKVIVAVDSLSPSPKNVTLYKFVSQKLVTCLKNIVGKIRWSNGPMIQASEVTDFPLTFSIRPWNQEEVKWEILSTLQGQIDEWFLLPFSSIRKQNLSLSLCKEGLFGFCNEKQIRSLDLATRKSLDSCRSGNKNSCSELITRIKGFQFLFANKAKEIDHCLFFGGEYCQGKPLTQSQEVTSKVTNQIDLRHGSLKCLQSESPCVAAEKARSSLCEEISSRYFFDNCDDLLSVFRIENDMKWLREDERKFVRRLFTLPFDPGQPSGLKQPPSKGLFEFLNKRCERDGLGRIKNKACVLSLMILDEIQDYKNTNSKLNELCLSNDNLFKFYPCLSISMNAKKFGDLENEKKFKDRACDGWNDLYDMMEVQTTAPSIQCEILP